MRMTLLILGAAVVPLIWGWGVYRLVARFWPQKRFRQVGRGPDYPAPPIDYQI